MASRRGIRRGKRGRRRLDQLAERTRQEARGLSRRQRLAARRTMRAHTLCGALLPTYTRSRRHRASHREVGGISPGLQAGS